MKAVDIQTAAAELTELVLAIELERETEIVIARDGHPVAKLVPVDAAARMTRIGVAKGKFEVPDSIDASDDEVTRQFTLPHG